MSKQHHYQTLLEWTGNKGKGTLNYRAYDRNHLIKVEGKPDLLGSSDPSFRGDTSRYNPEELLVASLSGCHMLWFLHLCSVNKIIVMDYKDEAKGIMEENKDGSGFFKSVTLYPKVIITEASMIETAQSLHHQANKMCFIANSVNFEVLHEPSCQVQQ